MQKSNSGDGLEYTWTFLGPYRFAGWQILAQYSVRDAYFVWLDIRQSVCNSFICISCENIDQTEFYRDSVSRILCLLSFFTVPIIGKYFW